MYSRDAAPKPPKRRETIGLELTVVDRNRRNGLQDEPLLLAFLLAFYVTLVAQGSTTVNVDAARSRACW
jgi:hypothetical protein